MSHDYHQGEPGYNEHQLYKDGCAECASRAVGDYPFEFVDLRYAWGRALRFERGRLAPEESPVSATEVPLLRILWSLMILMERDGIPLGQYPGDTAAILRRGCGHLRG